MAPGSLRLELTESALIGNPESTRKALQRLRAAGIGLYMDDFGTGYSSLGLLRALPFDTLKIDRSFISGLGGNAASEEIVRAILTLAHGLGMDVVAEGIETAEQLALLRELGCHWGQGYYFSRPMDVRAANAWLSARRQAEAGER